MKKTKIGIVGAILATISASAAMAVGNPPTKLNRRQAAAVLATVRPLLLNDGVGCPRGQVPTSGMMTGGSGPGFGSQKTTIRFDKGATVTIERQWQSSNSGRPKATVTVTCA